MASVKSTRVTARKRASSKPAQRLRTVRRTQTQRPAAQIKKMSQLGNSMPKDQRNAIYAIIAIVAIVFFVLMTRGNSDGNIGGEAVRPPTYTNCEQYWQNYCLSYECISGSAACESNCMGKTSRRCTPSRV